MNVEISFSRVRKPWTANSKKHLVVVGSALPPRATTDRIPPHRTVVHSDRGTQCQTRDRHGDAKSDRHTPPSTNSKTSTHLPLLTDAMSSHPSGVPHCSMGP